MQQKSDRVDAKKKAEADHNEKLQKEAARKLAFMCPHCKVRTRSGLFSPSRFMAAFDSILCTFPMYISTVCWPAANGHWPRSGQAAF
jgi:hypothetical protein